MLGALYNFFFGEEDNSPITLLDGATMVTISPKVGLDKSKMLKELEKVFGKDGKNVIPAEKIDELDLGIMFLSEECSKDLEAAFKTYLESNRGFNGDMETLLSKDGMKHIESLPFNEDGNKESDGWIFYSQSSGEALKDRAISRMNDKIAKGASKAFQHEEIVSIAGVPCECPSCSVHFGSYRGSLSGGADTLACSRCWSSIVGSDWFEKALPELQELETKLGKEFLPKKKAA